MWEGFDYQRRPYDFLAIRIDGKLHAVTISYDNNASNVMNINEAGLDMTIGKDLFESENGFEVVINGDETSISIAMGCGVVSWGG
jgi:hypothetical protein